LKIPKWTKSDIREFEKRAFSDEVIEKRENVDNLA
jgi:hypothetical protein